MLQLLVVAAAIGIAALKVGAKAEPFLQFNASLLAIVQKVLWWIIRLAPIGTAALIANAVATYGWDAIGSLGWFTAAVYIGLAVVFLVVYPVLIRAHGLSVRAFYSGVWPATQLGFVSRSSIGTLPPLTERVTERNLGVPPREYASFAVPLGSTTKMDGCAAIYPAIAAIFVAEFYGVPLSFTDYLLIIVVSVIGSAATAGTTGATVMLTLTLSTLGLPLAGGVGLLLAVEPIVDMGRTAVNVTGQALVPTIVAKREASSTKPATTPNGPATRSRTTNRSQRSSETLDESLPPHVEGSRHGRPRRDQTTDRHAIPAARRQPALHATVEPDTPRDHRPRQRTAPRHAHRWPATGHRILAGVRVR